MSDQTTDSVTIGLERNGFDFLLTLNKDGTALLNDLTYEETVTFTHAFDHAALDSIASARPTDGGYVKESDLDPIFEDDIFELFEEANDELENPVGECDADEPMSVGKGTENEFNTALAATLNLAILSNTDDDGSLHFRPGPCDDDDDDDGFVFYNDTPEDLSDLLIEICNVFAVKSGYTYEYVDTNDGRVTAYAKSADSIYFGREEIETYLPSARERIDARKTLKELIGKYGGDAAIVDRAFPMSHISPDEETVN